MEIKTDDLLTNNDTNDNNNYFFEEDILSELDDDFSYQIKERGKKYYKDGNIVQCCKANNKYYAKVRGTNEKPYFINVEINEYGIEYNCTCPCDFPCKHEYAVLIAISNKEYETIELKEEIEEKKNSLQNILKNIPAEEIKEYLLSPKGIDYVCFEINSFECYFRKYYPKQSYEFYYNNLFNFLVLNDEYYEIVNSYLDKIKQYISNLEFNESYKIIKSIIEAYNDTNKLNFDEYIVDLFPTLGMLLRVVYRKSEAHLKEEIVNWLKELELKDYYNNFYLEDIILSI